MRLSTSFGNSLKTEQKQQRFFFFGPILAFQKTACLALWLQRGNRFFFTWERNSAAEHQPARQAERLQGKIRITCDIKKRISPALAFLLVHSFIIHILNPLNPEDRVTGVSWSLAAFFTLQLNSASKLTVSLKFLRFFLGNICDVNSVMSDAQRGKSQGRPLVSTLETANGYAVRCRQLIFLLPSAEARPS